VNLRQAEARAAEQTDRADAKRIIAINKDRDVSIFQIAHLGIVGNALKVIPAVIEELHKHLAAVQNQAQPVTVG
jgi:hypothetical protein